MEKSLFKTWQYIVAQDMRQHLKITNILRNGNAAWGFRAMCCAERKF